MSRFPLFNLSHQKNINSQTPGPHTKHPMQGTSDMNQLFSSSKTISSQNAPLGIQKNALSSKEGAFFVGKGQHDNENEQFQGIQLPPVEQKFSKPYQIFESMITDEIKELEEIFSTYEVAGCREQRKDAFGCFIDVKQLDNIVQGKFQEFETFSSEIKQMNLRVPENEYSYKKEAEKSIHELSASFDQMQNSILSSDLEVEICDQLYD